MGSNSRFDRSFTGPASSSQGDETTSSLALSRRLTRRTLLRAAAGALAGASGLGVFASCAPSVPAATPVPAKPAETKPAAAPPTAAPAAAAPTAAPAAPAPTAAPAAAPHPTGAPQAAAPAVSKKVSIRYWTFLDPKDTGPRSVAQTQMLELFKTKQPNIEVVIEIAPWQTVDQQLIQAAAANKTPEVIRIFSQNLAMHIPAKTILPLDDFFKHWSKEQREDFLFPWEDTVWNGQKMAFYGDHRVKLMWYRADLLEAKGLKLPRTLEEVGEVGKALTTDRVVGYGMALSRAQNASDLMEWFIPNLWGQGSQLLNADGTAAFNSEGGVRLFQWLSDMIYKHKAMPAGATSWSADNVLDNVKAGTLAITQGGTHRVVAARSGQGIGKNLKTMRFVTDTPDKAAGAYVMGQTYVMGKDAKEKEAAWLLIEHLISPEALAINAKVAGELPVRKSATKDPWFQTADAADVREWMAYIGEQGRSIRLPEKFLALSDTVALAVQEMVANQVPAKKVLDDAAKKWNTEIGKA